MSATLINFPLALVVDGILSFIQSRFKNPAIVPSEYRWHTSDKCSKIRISGQYPIDNAKPGSVPSITVRRSGLQFANRAIDNASRAEPNTFENAVYQDWMDGTIDIMCEGEGSEASTLANFLAIEFQANRHDIVNVLQFIRHISYLDVGPEIIVDKNVEPRRYQVLLRLKVSVYLGWIKRSEDTIPFNKLAIRDIDSDCTWESDGGSLTIGESYIDDDSADFGLLLTNNPQLLEAELTKKWYYVMIGDSNRLYQVEEILTNHRLRLSDKDATDSIIPFNPIETKSGVSYKVLWNSVHIYIELPKV